MSDHNTPESATRVLVEVHTLFTASSHDEAQALLDQVMDAELAVVCPPDASRLTTCGHCGGTLMNPDTRDESSELTEPGDRWVPGAPCAMCADTDHPGQELQCAREHVGGATIHADGIWLTTEDRRLEAILRNILALLDKGDVDSARHHATEALAELKAST